jgi:hypothetical protein
MRTSSRIILSDAWVARRDGWSLAILRYGSFQFFFTSPGLGPVGEVGVIAIDDKTGQVAGGTERHEVAKAMCTFKESKRDDLEAA